MTGRAVGDACLPCLYSNNSIENAPKGTQEINNGIQKVEAIAALTSLLSPYHKKAAQTLFLNVQRLVNEVPNIGHIAFLTLTFKDNVTDHREAYRRYRSWNTNFFSKHPAFGHYINTKEVQTRGAWHFHILIQLNIDIREGFDFEAYREWLEGNNRFNQKCPTGNASLRSLWADLRENLEPYGLGKIHSLEPIESTAEAIGRYVGKYISKHIEKRTEEQKGVRLVNYSRGWLRNSVKFAWNTLNSREWRRKLSKFAKTLGCSELYQLSEKLGPGWVYKYLDDIIAIDQTCFERLFNDRAEGFERNVPEFESNTVEKILLNQESEKRVLADPRVNQKKRLAVKKKKHETKRYIGKLKLEYVNEWLSDNSHENSLSDTLKEMKEELDRYHMKKRCRSIEKYHDEQSVYILKTGEVIPF